MCADTDVRRRNFALAGPLTVRSILKYVATDLSFSPMIPLASALGLDGDPTVFEDILGRLKGRLVADRRISASDQIG